MTIMDKSIDLVIEKTSNTRSRVGHTMSRIAQMDQKGVDHDVIALQLTKNSTHGETYTTGDVKSFLKLHKDAETKVVVTKEQTSALIKDQQKGYDDSFSPA